MHLLALALVVAATSAPVASAQAQKNPRAQCGCPTARLLGRGTIDLDKQRALSAWLHDDAELLPFIRDAENPQKLNPTEAPIALTPFPGGAQGSERFVHVTATGALAAGSFVGILRKKDPSPRDVVGVTATAASAALDPQAPHVSALWLAGIEQRERPGCGAFLTHMITFELFPESPPIEAFLVKDLEHPAAPGVLVDARSAGAFGLGRVDVCDIGIPLEANKKVELEVRPVSASFGVGEAWQFRSDGTGQTDTIRKLIPKDADESRCKDPFPIPGQDEGKGLTLKQMAVTIMGVVVGGAAIFAFFVFVVIPMRKRRMVDIKCPSCGSAVPVDALDPKTDGFFCPSCGKAGFWKGKNDAAMDAKTL